MGLLVWYCLHSIPACSSALWRPLHAHQPSTSSWKRWPLRVARWVEEPLPMCRSADGGRSPYWYSIGFCGGRTKKHFNHFCGGRCHKYAWKPTEALFLRLWSFLCNPSFPGVLEVKSLNQKSWCLFDEMPGSWVGSLNK
jgi:hypothetical protein